MNGAPRQARGQLPAHSRVYLRQDEKTHVHLSFSHAGCAIVDVLNIFLRALQIQTVLINLLACYITNAHKEYIRRFCMVGASN